MPELPIWYDECRGLEMLHELDWKTVAKAIVKHSTLNVPWSNNLEKLLDEVAKGLYFMNDSAAEGRAIDAHYRGTKQ